MTPRPTGSRPHAGGRTLAWSVCLCGSLLLAFGSEAHAQFGGGGEMGGSPRMSRGKGAGADGNRGQPAARIGSRVEQVSRTMYDLRIELLIEREQAPAWEAFRRSYMDLALTAPGPAEPPDGQAALQLLQRQRDAAAARLQQLDGLQQATQALLAVLNPDQTRSAEKALPLLLANWQRSGGQGEGLAGQR